MEYQQFQAIFCSAFEKNGLTQYGNEETVALFYQFTKLLTETNQHTNLTAIREIPEIISKHYVDCLLAEQYFPKGASVLDIGCGGGFPTFPLAIARPDLKITAIDSTGKKIAFVESAAKALNLANITPICARIEDASLASRKGTFDIVTSRAVAAMPVLAELALPFVKVGGTFIAMKGAQGAEELALAEKAIATLGGSIEADQLMNLITDVATENRHIILIKKIKTTGLQYPRPYAQILKRPL